MSELGCMVPGQISKDRALRQGIARPAVGAVHPPYYFSASEKARQISLGRVVHAHTTHEKMGARGYIYQVGTKIELEFVQNTQGIAGPFGGGDLSQIQVHRPIFQFIFDQQRKGIPQCQNGLVYVGHLVLGQYILTLSIEKAGFRRKRGVDHHCGQSGLGQHQGVKLHKLHVPKRKSGPSG